MSDEDLPPCTRITSQTARDSRSPHASWDLDVGDGTSWLRALQICEGCPFVGWCVEERADHLRLQHGNPRDVIWAGVAYSSLGQPMSVKDLRLRATLQAHRQARRQRHLAGREQAAS